MHEGCRKFVLPKSNSEYWSPKLLRNKERDLENTRALEANGWNVIVIWECELKKNVRQKRFDLLLKEITQR